MDQAISKRMLDHYEKKKMFDKLNEAKIKLTNLKKEEKDLRQQRTTTITNHLAASEGAKISRGNISIQVKKNAEEGIAFLEKITSRTIISSLATCKFTFVEESKNDEKVREKYNKNTGVNISAQTQPQTVIHELGHWIEDKNPKVHGQCIDFLNYRCEGEESQPLQKLTGNKSYKEDEYARKDKFFDPYCGKDYLNPKTKKRVGTEILSMGIEQLYTDPVSFAKKDPEYFNFIVLLLHNKL